MKQIKTLSNSFALIETDGNGKVLTQFGFRKGGLSYFIRNNNVKFYLTEDFFYKNVVWSADAPLMIDGIPYDIDALPDALKKIFILEDEGGGGGITVDQTLSTASTNPIGNQAVAHAVDDLNEAVSDRYTKTETNSLLDTKLDVTAYTPTDLSQYWTSGETQSAITQSLSGYATEQWVENQGYLTEHQSLSGYATTADTTDINNTLTAHTANTSVHVTSQEKTYWNNKLDASAYTPTDLSNYYTKGQTDDLLDDKLDVTAYTPTDLSNYYTKGETDGVINGAVSGKADTSAVTESINAAVSGKADTTYVNQIASQATDAITALTQTVSNNYNELTGQTSDLYVQKFGDARYDSATHRINFYAHGNSTDILAYVDASAFIKDGMVSNVEISNGNLVITFNSDAGKQPISIPLTDIFNPANYYTTAQTQSYVEGYTYDKATIDQKVAEGGTFDPDLYYDKTATDALLAAKADTATTYTKTEVDNALSSKADTSAVTAVASDVQTVSGQVATKVATSDFNTYTAATETALNGKVNTSALNDYYTKTEVYNKTEVDAAYTTTYQALTAHTADTNVHVTSAEKTTWNNKSDFSGDYNDLTNKPTIPSKTSDLTNDSDFATTGDVHTATNDMATKTWVGNQGYLTEHQSLSNYYTKSETSGATEISTALASKQSTLESGTNIKTINNESILGSGNITIEGGGSSYTAGDGIDITNDVISVTGKADTTAVTQVNDALTAHTANTSVHVTAAEKAEWDDKAEVIELTQAQYDALVTKDPDVLYVISDATAADITNYYTKAQTDDLLDAKADTATTYTKTEVDTALGGKQATLVSGTNIKTINNESILGEGNIEIQGGGATYSAGTNISIDTANTINCTLPITANSTTFIAGNPSKATNGNILIGSTGLVSTAVTNSVTIGYGAKGGYSTVAIGQGATAGTLSKANDIAIGVNAKAQGGSFIAIGTSTNATGTTKMNLNNQIKVDTNNQVYIKDKTNTTDVCIQDAIAALGGLKFVKLTQNEYDQLATKDNDTLYIISNVVS